MGELSGLPNIGPVVELQLNTVGIHTYKQLKAEDSRQAWLKIKAVDDSAYIHRLYSLEGAIQGIKNPNCRLMQRLSSRNFTKAIHRNEGRIFYE